MTPHPTLTALTLAMGLLLTLPTVLFAQSLGTPPASERPQPPAAETEDHIPVAPQVPKAEEPAIEAEPTPLEPKPAEPVPPAEPEYQPIANELEMFELLGVDSSHFDNIFPGGDLTPDEYETMLRVMYALRKFTQVDIEAWADEPKSLAEHAIKQGELVLFAGVATRCERIEPIAEQRVRFDIPAFYRIEVKVGASHFPVTVYSLQVPKAWSLDTDMEERISCYAALVKKGGKPEPALVFASQRVAWYSNSVLGDLEMDMSLFDDVVDQSRLTGFDRECFYQLLVAVDRAGPKELERRTKDELRRINSGRPADKQLEGFQLVDLIRAPNDYQGQLMGFRGVARRAVKVRVSDNDILERFGVDHFYEIEVFVDLGGRYKLYDDSDITFYKYPAVFCVRQLPKGMPTGEAIHEEVFIPGFFLKNWTYSSKFSQAEGKSTKQMAPLLIGKQPLLIVPSESGNPYASVIAGGFFVVALAGVWLAIWRFGRSDAHFERTVLAKTLEPEAASLNDLDLDVQVEPDFRDLT